MWEEEEERAMKGTTILDRSLNLSLSICRSKHPRLPGHQIRGACFTLASLPLSVEYFTSSVNIIEGSLSQFYLTVFLMSVVCV